jgi:hypothetical protein
MAMFLTLGVPEGFCSKHLYVQPFVCRSGVRIDRTYDI